MTQWLIPVLFSYVPTNGFSHRRKYESLLRKSALLQSAVTVMELVKLTDLQGNFAPFSFDGKLSNFGALTGSRPLLYLPSSQPAASCLL